ncbi:MAG: nucleotidyltransferase domain-containing protein [Gammaproteobacteria bacterium]|nr:nucleotidyltransferase domain-containing protein [Gammaproteobacteria bacterium]
MRLSKIEIDHIIQALKPFVSNLYSELRLYGSRVDDNAKGGDIDLLLIVSDQQTKSQLLQQKIEMLMAIKELIGEQRIDFKISAKDEISTDPFLQIIYPKSVSLHLFK